MSTCDYYKHGPTILSNFIDDYKFSRIRLLYIHTYLKLYKYVIMEIVRRPPLIRFHLCGVSILTASCLSILEMTILSNAPYFISQIDSSLACQMNVINS